MWTPNESSLSELINFLNKTQISDNAIQKEQYKQFEKYAKDPSFHKTLIYVLNSTSQSNDIRNLAGTVLKSQLELNSRFLSEEVIAFFKANIISCFFDKDFQIRKIVSNLINTFIRHFGMDAWPEVLSLIEENLDKKEGNEISIETLNIILEDCQGEIDEQFSESMRKIVEKLIFCLKNSKFNNHLCSVFLNTISIFLDSCQDITLEKLSEIVPLLKEYSRNEDNEVKSKVAKCWYSVIHLEKRYLNEYCDDLFSFFINNFNITNIDQSFASSEFFLYVISSEENFLRFDNIKQTLKNKLTALIPILLQNMKLTDTDINYLDNKFQVEKATNDSNSEDEEFNTETTLRKSCSRILDNLSNIYPIETFQNMRPILENDIQSEEDITKEHSILALGAIANGSYQQVINHLVTLVPFLIRELQHPNMYIRAIACWTLSRYTKFIMVDNYQEGKEELFKEYLTEILKKFLDKENMVRESAGTAFQEMINVNKNMIEPYLFDVLKIITNVFDKFAGLNLLSSYEILIILMENFNDQFQNQNLVDDIVKCIVQKWYDLVKANDLLTLPSFFDVINTLIHVGGPFLLDYCDYFLTGCLKIIEANMNEMRSNNYLTTNVDKDLLSKALDTISALAQSFPNYLKNSFNKFNILDFLIEILQAKDLYVIHYTIALIGDITKLELKAIEEKCEKIIEILIPFIELKPKKHENPSEKLSVCNNSIWTIGLLAIFYPQKISPYIDTIMLKFKDILALSKVDITFYLFYRSTNLLYKICLSA